jgi:hypothetical protein
MAPFACLVVYTALEESSLEKLLTSEEGRESAGVLIVVFWLILLLFYDKDRRFDKICFCSAIYYNRVLVSDQQPH